MDWRRVFHILIHSLIALVIFVLEPTTSAIVLTVIAAASCGIELPWVKPKVLAMVEAGLGPVVRPHERHRISAPTWSYVGIAAILWTCRFVNLPSAVAVAGVLVLAFCDPVAGLVRYRLRWASHPFVRRVAGSIIFFAAAFVLLWLLLRLFPEALGLTVLTPVWELLVGALAATVVELIAVRHIDDNGVVPAAVVLALLLTGDYESRQIWAATATLASMAAVMFVINAALARHTGLSEDAP